MFVKSFLKRPVIVISFIGFVLVFALVGKFSFVTEAETNPQAAMLVPTITATNVDALFTDVDGDGRADPGDTIEYTVTVNNTAAAGAGNDALNMQFNETLDANTTLVGGSVVASPIAVNDSFSSIGNVGINVPAGSGVFANDINPGGGMLTVQNTNTAGLQGTLSLNSSVGAFDFTPNPGFEGTTTFTYTVANGSGFTSTATVTINVSGMIWFVNANAGVNGDGRLGAPFNSLANFNAGAADDPTDSIFLFESATPYTGGITLLSGQKLIGQDATATLATIAGVTVPSFSSPTLPVMNSANGTVTNLPSTMTLVANTTLRGFSINTTTTTGVSGGAVSGVTTGDLKVTTTTATAVSLSGTGGTLSFTSISSNGAANGISLTNTTGSFTVVGDGTDNTVGGNFSGGTIQNSTTGILLTNVQNVSLNRIRITTTTSDGISGTTVNGFTFANSQVINFGDDVAVNPDTDSGMQFVNLIGTVVIKRSIIGPNTGYALLDSPPGAANDGIEVDNTNQSLLTMTVTGSQFTNVSDDGIDVRGQNSDVTLNVDGSTADGANTFTGINGRSVLLEDNNDLANNSNFNIAVNNNTFTNVGIGALWNIHAGSTVVANFNNNTMSGTRDDAIRSLINPSAQVSGFSATTLDATIRGNNMGGGCIFIVSRRGGTSTVRLGGAGAGQGNTNIRGAVGTANNGLSHPDPVTMEASRGGVLNIDMLQNNVLANGIFPGENTYSTIWMQTLAGGFAGTAICANIANNTVTLQNPDPTHAFNANSPIWIDNNSGLGSATIALEGFGGGGNAAAGTFLNTNNTMSPAATDVSQWFGTVTAGGNCVNPFAPGLTDEGFEQTSPAPVFENENIDAEPTNQAGGSTKEISVIEPIKQESVSLSNSLASLENTFSRIYNGLSQAISPTAMAEETSNISSAPFSGETINVGAPTGFTLPATKSITIKFRATVNNTPVGLTQVSTQGTVSGSNFASVLTDDTAVGGGADPTATLIDSTTVTVSSSQNPSITGQSVTFTATLTGAPVHGAGNPGGTVQFFDNGVAIGAPVAVVAGAVNTSTAQFVTSSLTAGNHPITATYSGGAGFNANNTSNTVNQSVSNTAVWDGSTSTAWADGTNWTTNGAPSLATNDVSIPAAGVTNNPIISAANVTVNNLTLSAGRTLTINTNRTLNINGLLTMNGNNIDASSGVVAFSSSGTVTRTSGSILGNVDKSFTATGAFNYPVGTATGYSPVAVNITALATNPSTLRVLANDGTAPAVPVLADATTLDRFWTLTETGDLTANVVFNYLEADVDGTETNYKTIRVVGTTATSLPNGVPCPGAGSPCVDAAANTITVNALQAFSNWTAGELAPVAANVSVGGRVLTADGQAVANAQVSMIDGDGNTRMVRTSPFGYYRFDDVPAGATYTVSVSHKQYQFTPQVVSVGEDVSELNFMALP